MSIDHRKKFLEAAAHDLADGKAPHGIDSTIASWLEEDLATFNGDEMKETHLLLHDYFDKLFRLLPDEKMLALRDMTDNILMIAYHVGIANMAQITAARAMTRRAGHTTMEILNDPENLDTLIAMEGQDRSKDEIAELCGTDVDAVATRLRRFQVEGIADFVNDGTKVVWFLTPYIVPAVQEMRKQRDRNRAVEAALAVLREVDGEAAHAASAALQDAFREAEFACISSMMPGSLKFSVCPVRIAGTTKSPS